MTKSDAELADTLAEIDDCDARIAANPSDYSAYFARGLAKTELDLHEAAVKDFSKAIRLNPDCAAAYLNRSCCYDALGKEELSEKDMKMYEKLRSEEDPHGLFN